MEENFNNEECFWLLCHIIECKLPNDYFTTMTGAICDQWIFNDILAVIKPNIRK